MRYYIDTCVWLNIFKKETTYKESKRVIEKLNNSRIIVSKMVLNEIERKVQNQFDLINQYFIKKENIIIEKLKNEDYKNARDLEKETKYLLGFGDCMHITICKRMNTILITRDKDLIKIGRKYIIILTPKEIIHQFY